MKGQQKKVIAAGHICLDVTPIFPETLKKSPKDIIVPGKLIYMDGVDIHAGGAAVNTGLAMKILGANVGILGKVGNDAFGNIVSKLLADYNAEGGLIIDENAPTSYSVVLALPGNDRIFLHDPGANDTYCAEDITDEMLEDVCLFHFGYPTLMRRMYENQGEELLSLLKRVKNKGIITSLDLTAVDPTSEAGRAEWKKILTKVLPYVDIFAPSFEELLFMLDRDKYNKLIEEAEGRELIDIIKIQQDVKPLAEELIRMGVGIVMIKCGAPGVYYQTAGKNRIDLLGNLLDNPGEWYEREGFEKSYKPQKVGSATGAGDTTIAAFLKAILDGYTLDMCLKLATATGALCVETYDVLSGIKPFDSLIEKIGQGWEKQSILE